MKKNLFLIPALCLLCCACQQDNRNKSNKNPSEVTLEDWELTAQVKTAIMTDSTISTVARIVSVNSRDGVVTLTGTVPTKEDKDRIEQIAKKVPGVSKVENQITVSAQ